MSFEPELTYAPLTAAWPDKGFDESIVGPVLAKMKGKDAASPMKPIKQPATRKLLLVVPGRLFMQRTVLT